MSDSSFDLIVIGAGPGGYVAAIRAAQLGMRVACIEKDAALGGTCLNVGCIPSKALLDSSELFYEAKNGFAHHGIKAGELSLDIPAMLSRKDNVVQSLTRGVAGLFRKNRVEHVRGTAPLTAPGHRRSHQRRRRHHADREEHSHRHRQRPVALPSMPFDDNNFIDSTGALVLPEVPNRLLIIGAGAIGLDLGSVWAASGPR